MGIDLNTILFLAHNKRRLGMCLQSDETIGHVDACVFKGSRPFDVSLFIETGLQFNQDGHLFAPLRGLDQRPADRRVGAGPVKRQLDRQNLRVPGSRFDESLCAGGKTVVRVVDQHITFSDNGKYVGRPGLAADARKRGMCLGGPRLIFQMGQIDIGERQQVCHAQRTFVGIDIGVVQFHLLHQNGADVVRHRLGYFQADDWGKAAFAQLLADH